MSKIVFILVVIHYSIYEALCFQFTQFPRDGWENILLCLIIIIKSEVWTVIHWSIVLDHETMVCAACLFIFSWFLNRNMKHDICFRFINRQRDIGSYQYCSLWDYCCLWSIPTALLSWTWQPLTKCVASWVVWSTRCIKELGSQLNKNGGWSWKLHSKEWKQFTFSLHICRIIHVCILLDFIHFSRTLVIQTNICVQRVCL